MININYHKNPRRQSSDLDKEMKIRLEHSEMTLGVIAESSNEGGMFGRKTLWSTLFFTFSDESINKITRKIVKSFILTKKVCFHFLLSNVT